MLRDKALNITKNPKHDGYQRGFASMVYKVFDKSSADSGATMSENNEIKQNLQLAEELNKPIIRNFSKRTVYYGFRENILGVDLADMQLISKFKGFRFLLCVIDIFSKYTWVVPKKV